MFQKQPSTKILHKIGTLVATHPRGSIVIWGLLLFANSSTLIFLFNFNDIFQNQALVSIGQFLHSKNIENIFIDTTIFPADINKLILNKIGAIFLLSTLYYLIIPLYLRLGIFEFRISSNYLYRNYRKIVVLLIFSTIFICRPLIQDTRIVLIYIMMLNFLHYSFIGFFFKFREIASYDSYISGKKKRLR